MPAPLLRGHGNDYLQGQRGFIAVKMRTFLAFVGPSLAMMIIFIALPLF